MGIDGVRFYLSTRLLGSERERETRNRRQAPLCITDPTVEDRGGLAVKQGRQLDVLGHVSNCCWVFWQNVDSPVNGDDNMVQLQNFIDGKITYLSMIT